MSPAALAEIASGLDRLAAGMRQLADEAAADERRRPVKAEEYLSPIEAVELAGGAISRRTLYRITAGMPFVRKLTQRRVVFERAGFVRWLRTRESGNGTVVQLQAVGR